MLGRATAAVTELSLVRRAFTTTRPGRAVARRFVAGETLEEAIAAATKLAAMGFDISLDHLGEHVTHTDEALRARDDYMACLERIGQSGLSANISIKLTQLGVGFDDDLAAASLAELATVAANFGTTVTVDMEESRYTAATIALYTSAQRAHGNLGIAVQAYLHRTKADVDGLIELGGHIRLCKGAYAEPEEAAFQSNDDVDAEFDALLDVLMKAAGTTPAIATHDEARIDLAKRLASARDGPYEFQMLYGVRGPLQRELLDAGYPVRIYVPYGVAWYPYLTRRLAERPANTLFFLRALFGRR